MPALLARRLDVPDKHQARMVIDSAIREVLTELAELPNVITRGQYEAFEAKNGEKRPEKRKNPRPGCAERPQEAV